MKMSDAEIIKALEYCSKNTNPFICTENKCPLFGEKCIDILTENALALINRQQAKIERLKRERDMEHNYCNHYARMCAKSKSESYKEFAERLCADRISNDPVVIAVKAELKEMG